MPKIEPSTVHRPFIATASKHVLDEPKTINLMAQ